MIRYLFLIILLSCSRLTPEEAALTFMKARYFNPSEAHRMLAEGDISKDNFMKQHEQMLRVKDYKLREVISFKVVKTETKDKVSFVTIETIRPNVILIFKNFYQEKLEGTWDKAKIKGEIIRRLKDPSSPKEKLVTVIKVEKIKGQQRIRWEKP